MDKFLLGTFVGLVIAFCALIYLILENDKYNSACTEAYYKQIKLEVCQNFIPFGVDDKKKK